MKYTCCIAIRKTVSDRELYKLKRNARKKVAIIGHGPWRDTPAEAEKDGELFAQDPEAFQKIARGK